jgi:hypothetical protein
MDPAWLARVPALSAFTRVFALWSRTVPCSGVWKVPGQARDIVTAMSQPIRVKKRSRWQLGRVHAGETAEGCRPADAVLAEAAR